MGYFELPIGIKILTDQPLDGDRYLKADLVERDLLITNGRGHIGLQVYVEDAGAGQPKLFVLTSITPTIWEIISIGGSFGDAGMFKDYYPGMATWTMDHNFGKLPSVTLLDGAGDPIEAHVTYTDLNTVNIFFPVPVAGRMICN